MADLALVRLASGRYDFVRSGGDLVRTGSATPQILRLLIQGAWLGDDGERAGQSLADLTISTSQTEAQIQRIVESRLAVLVQTGRLVSVRVVSVENTGDKAFARIEVTEPGQQPAIIQVPLKA